MRLFAGRFAPAFLIAALFVVVSSITRALLAVSSGLGPSAGVGEWVRIFGLGLLFDVVAANYVALPVALWLALVPDRVARAWPHRALTLLVFAASAYGVTVLAIAEWLFWDEFGSRFNFIAVDYLLYTHEVLGNIWQSYPVGRMLLALGLGAVLLTLPVAKLLCRASGKPASWRAAVLVALAWIAAAAGTLRFVDSDMKNFSSRDSANDLAGNGLYEFFAANYRNELNYERHYRTLPPEGALELVRTAVGAESEGTERHVRSPRPERRLNVVLVSVESLGAEFLGAYGNRKGLTPNLDRLADASLWFSRVYATGNRTVRGLEALSLALPPTPGQSIVRRPHNETLFSLGSVFEDKDYAVLFAYGGYGYFDNMNAFFDANDYRSVDRRAIPSERIEHETVWGVADEHLFDQVIDEIDREQQAQPQRPFFVHVMTTSKSPSVHLSRGPHRHRVGERARRGGQVHRLRDRQVPRAGARQAVVWRYGIRHHGRPRRERARHQPHPDRELPHPGLRLLATLRRAASRGPPDVADRRAADAARPARLRLLQQVLRPRRAPFAAELGPRVRSQLPDARLHDARAPGAAPAAPQGRGVPGRRRPAHPRAGGRCAGAARSDRVLFGRLLRIPPRPLPGRGADAARAARRAAAGTRRQLAFAAAALVLLLAFHAAGLDRAASSLFYDPAARSFPLRDDWFLARIGHEGIKWAMLAFWAGCLGLGGAWRRGALYMALIAAVVGILRHYSPFSCPWDLVEYGGRNPDAGRCLPAGHPLVGFTLLGLHLALKERRPRAARIAAAAALAIGFAAGAVQVARGAHFVSHVLWTAWIAWAVTLALAVPAPPRA